MFLIYLFELSLSPPPKKNVNGVAKAHSTITSDADADMVSSCVFVITSKQVFVHSIYLIQTVFVTRRRR